MYVLYNNGLVHSLLLWRSFLGRLAIMAWIYLHVNSALLLQ